MNADLFSLEYFLFAVKFSVSLTVVVFGLYFLLRVINVLLVEKNKDSAKVDKASQFVWRFIVVVSIPFNSLMDALGNKKPPKDD